eukprot:jgi/Bigna1/132447/aug1.17_g7155
MRLQAFAVGVGIMGLTYANLKLTVYAASERLNMAIDSIRVDMGIPGAAPLKIKEPVTNFGSELNDKMVSNWNQGILKIHQMVVDKYLKP